MHMCCGEVNAQVILAFHGVVGEPTKIVRLQVLFTGTILPDTP